MSSVSRERSGQDLFAFSNLLVVGVVRALEIGIEQAYHDPLTELPNRRALEDAFSSTWALAKRYQNGEPGALMALDLDGFKKFNDTKGHPEGDALLKQIAGIISGRLRKEDMVARLGGDEFAVLAQRTDLEGGTSLAKKIRRRIAEQGNGVTASIGVAEINPHVQPHIIAKMADLALYEAKELGGNQVVAYSFKPLEPK